MLKKYENIQGLRGIAVLAVVLFHLNGIEHVMLPPPHILPNLLNLGCSGVDLFFVISGFVMMIVSHNHFGSWAASRHFIYHRITRIYPLYWVYAIFLLFAHNLIAHQHIKIASVFVLKSLLLFPQADIPFLAPAWTLIHEMYFYLIMMLLLLAPQNKFIKLLALWGIVVMGGNIFLHVTSKFSIPSLLLIFNPLTFEFIAGCLIGYLICYNIKYLPFLFTCVAVVLFILGCLFTYKYLRHLSTPASFIWQRVFAFGIPATFLVYAATVFEYYNKLLPNFLRTIGNYSYSIYLSHIIVLSIFVKLYTKFHIENIFLHCFLLIGIFCAILIVGKYSYLFLEKPILKYSRKWWEKLSFQPLQSEN